MGLISMEYILEGFECTAIGIEKYPIPANISTIVSPCFAIVDILFLSVVLPLDHIILDTSNLNEHLFSRCIVSVPSPIITSTSGSLFKPLIQIGRAHV